MSNPFFTMEDIDNNIRPYSQGFVEHDSCMASIILYTDSPPTNMPEKNNVNYMGPTNLEVVDGVIQLQDTDTNQETLKLLPSNIATIPGVSGNDALPYIGIFNNFSLLQVSEAKDQIIKLHQNFGSSWNLFFFGDSPQIYTFRGIFLDTQEYPYYQEFMYMYDRCLKGRKCVELGYRMKLAYDGKVVSGYMLNIQTVLSGDTPHSKSFSFTVITNDEFWMRRNAIPEPSSNGGYVLNYNQMNKLGNAHRVTRQYGSSGLLEHIQ